MAIYLLTILPVATARQTRGAMYGRRGAVLGSNFRCWHLLLRPTRRYFYFELRAGVAAAVVLKDAISGWYPVSTSVSTAAFRTKILPPYSTTPVERLNLQ